MHNEIVGKGYGHTESGERLLSMHAQQVAELILKKAGKDRDVPKQIELAAVVKDRRQPEQGPSCRVGHRGECQVG